MYLMMSSNVGGEGLVRLTRMRQVSIPPVCNTITTLIRASITKPAMITF